MLRITFKHGYIVICGRLIECEARKENSMLKETEHFPGDQH